MEWNDSMEGYILIVDDDPDVRYLVTQALGLLGLIGRSAMNGSEALTLIREQAPQAIILDIMMPEMDGFTTLMHIQREFVGHTIPVILLSGIADSIHNMDRLPGVRAVMVKGDFTMEKFRTSLAKAGVMAA